METSIGADTIQTVDVEPFWLDDETRNVQSQITQLRCLLSCSFGGKGVWKGGPQSHLKKQILEHKWKGSVIHLQICGQISTTKISSASNQQDMDCLSPSDSVLLP